MPCRLLFILAVLVAAVPSYAAEPVIRDGSAKAKAIPLKARDPAKAVDEEMAWMMKLHHYTPLLATRDFFVDIALQFKAGKKPGKDLPMPWGHATLEHQGHWISNWWFRRPGGRNTQIYFDTGASVTTPGEVPRQESARARYMGEKLKSFTKVEL